MTRSSLMFWLSYCKKLSDRELELESVICKDKITLFRICFFALSVIDLQSLNILLQTCFWRWQGQTNAFFRLAENNGVVICDSDDSAFDDDARTVSLFGTEQYAGLKVLSDFICFSKPFASPSLFSELSQVIYVNEASLDFWRMYRSNGSPKIEFLIPDTAFFGPQFSSSLFYSGPTLTFQDSVCSIFVAPSTDV